MSNQPCPHCGTGSKLHPVSAEYCGAYERGDLARLTQENARLKDAIGAALKVVEFGNGNYGGVPAMRQILQSVRSAGLPESESK